MRAYINSNVLLICLLTVSLGLTSGCSVRGGKGSEPRSLSTTSAKEFVAQRVNTIAILPLENGLGGSGLADEDLAQFTKALVSAFEANTSVDLVNLSKADVYGAAVKEVENARTAERAKAAELGRRLGVQGVLYGVISRYDDRADRGQRAGEGTIVSFKLWLIDPRTGADQWSAVFDKANIPLTDNLLMVGEAMQSGLRYRSAPDLMNYGFVEAAKALEKERLAPASNRY